MKTKKELRKMPFKDFSEYYYSILGYYPSSEWDRNDLIRDLEIITSCHWK